MKLKKTLALLSALSLMCAFAGCGEDSSNADSTADGTTTTSATTTASTTSATTTTTAPVVLEIDENAITFDTASFYTGHCMAESNFTNDEAECNLSIVELDGDAKLRVEVVGKNADTGEYKVPKIVFNLAELIGAENTGEIGQISVDFTCIAEGPITMEDGSEATIVANFLGALGGNLADEKGYDADGNLTQNTWANHYEFSLMDWENAEATWRVDAKIPQLLEVNGYADNNENATLVIMRWAQENQVDFYIDNLTIYDKDGNSMPIIYDAEANLAGDAAEGTDAPAEEGDTTETTSTEAAV